MKTEFDPGLQGIMQRVATVTGVTVEQIKSGDRTAGTAFARHIFCWDARRSGYRYAEIAGMIGRCGSAAVRAKKVIDGLVKIGDTQTLKILKKL
jgi:chromosomal replication initiation ATPase DnaA